MDVDRTSHDRIWIARHDAVDTGALRRTIRALRVAVAHGDGLAALADLCAAVPESEPSAAARQSAGSVNLSAALSLDDLSRLLVA